MGAIQTSVNSFWRYLLVVLPLVLVPLIKRSLTMVSPSKNLRLGLVTATIKVLYGLGVITFSHEYFTTLSEHAVPLDLRALNQLNSSALAMDIYAMLSDRLHRISGRPVVLYWRNLREQFGQEYTGDDADRNFKKVFLPALKRVLTVYPDAKVKKVTGGILMMSSPPPIPYRN